MAFLNFFANLAAKSITLVGTRYTLKRVKPRSNKMTSEVTRRTK